MGKGRNHQRHHASIHRFFKEFAHRTEIVLHSSMDRLYSKSSTESDLRDIDTPALPTDPARPHRLRNNPCRGRDPKFAFSPPQPFLEGPHQIDRQVGRPKLDHQKIRLGLPDAVRMADRPLRRKTGKADQPTVKSFPKISPHKSHEFRKKGSRLTKGNPGDHASSEPVDSQTLARKTLQIQPRSCKTLGRHGRQRKIAPAAANLPTKPTHDSNPWHRQDFSRPSSSTAHLESETFSTRRARLLTLRHRGSSFRGL